MGHTVLIANVKVYIIMKKRVDTGCASCHYQYFVYKLAMHIIVSVMHKTEMIKILDNKTV